MTTHSGATIASWLQQLTSIDVLAFFVVWAIAAYLALRGLGK